MRAKQRLSRLVPAALTAAVLAAGAAVPGARAGILAQSAEDLWDISQGATVTSSSPVLWFSNANMLFGGSNPSSPYEKTSTVYADYQPAGTVHFTEWQTAAPVTLRSFVLDASHDGPPRDANYRGISRVRLQAYVIDSWFDVWDGLFAQTYGDTVLGPEVVNESVANRLLIGVNVDPVTASRFRVEFTQRGAPSNASGPRINELDGYSTLIPAPASGLFMLAAVGFRRRR
jgi:hypothetical protein